MKRTFIIEETGEVITVDVKESYKVSPEQAKKVDREYYNSIEKAKHKKRGN